MMNVISRRKMGLFLCLIYLFDAPYAWSFGSTRLLLLRIAPDDALVLRTEFNSPIGESKSEAFEEMVKRKSLDVLADFNVADPWRAEPVGLEKAMGTIESGGERLDLGVKLKFEGRGKPEVSYNAEITLPSGGKGAGFFQAIGSTTVHLPAAWHERCCWGDGKEIMMLWEYPVVEVDAKEEPMQEVSAVQVEMHWFRASEVDISKLTASKPETRVKALQWLAGRAKLWREAGYGFKPGNPCIWQVSHGKHEPEKGASISDENFIVQTECRDEVGKLRMKWTMISTKMGEDRATTLKSDMTPEIWEFLPVSGNPDANVVACRVTKS